MAAEPQTTGIVKAAIKAGSIAALAREIGVAAQVANRWCKRGFAPPKRALQISQRYGIPARELVQPALLQVAARLAE